MPLAPRAVIVHRASELDELVDRHGTRGQVEFFLRSRGRTLADVQHRHDALAETLRVTSSAIPDDWRRGRVERVDLHRFAFAPEDVVLVVGPDGLVANTAKYLTGQPVVGVDPEPGRNPGVLVRHPGSAVGGILRGVVAGRVLPQGRAMVQAVLDDGTRLDALNDVYVGHPSHQSARYSLQLPDGRGEVQSSSGMVVSTGTGSTGWARSLAHDRGMRSLPGVDSDDLAWFVREAWPSPVTGVELTAGHLAPGQQLELLVQTDSLVVFGDGLEADRLTATWGQTVHISTSERRLQLVL